MIASDYLPTAKNMAQWPPLISLAQNGKNQQNGEIM
jgi:hypothetical protein